AEKVMGGPSWLELDRYTVIAKPPSGTSLANARLMLRPLLADRFKLTVHEDTRPLTAFAMTVVGGKPKMKEAAGGAPPGCQPAPPPQQPEPGGIPTAASESGGPIPAESRRRSDRAARCMGLRVQLHTTSASGSSGERRHH